MNNASVHQDVDFSIVLPFESTSSVHADDDLFTGRNNSIQTSFPIEPVMWQHTITGSEVASIVLYSIVFVLALVGNVLVIITLVCNRRMQTVTNCFLLSLSVSDLLLALVCMPVSITGQVLKRFVFGLTMCKIIPYFMGISVSVSTLTMLSISLERFNAICHPLKSRVWLTRKHAVQAVVCIWILCFVLMSPLAILNNLHYISIEDGNAYTFACRIKFVNRTAQKTWYLFLLISLFVVPGIVMAIAYSKVCWTIVRRFRLGPDPTTAEHCTGGNHEKGSETVRRPESPRMDGDGLYLPSTKHRSYWRRMGNSMRRMVKRTPSHLETCGEGPGLSVAVPNATLGASLRTTKQPHHCYCSQRYPGGSQRIEEAIARWHAKKRVVQMFIVILILYFVCWTPLYTINVWRAFDPEGAKSAMDGNIHIIHLLSYVSTCVNPVVYCFMNKRFRESFLFVFLCCVPRSCQPEFHKNAWRVRRVPLDRPLGPRQGYNLQEKRSPPTPGITKRVAIRVDHESQQS